ncbi:MAG: hypothetical protein GY773_16035, partial [Actinomycetia bacterium]|nr:hypothetical protein [Actinomycetes bacterium]
MGLVVSSAIHTPGKDHFWAIALMSAAYAVWLGQARLYQSRFITRRTDEIRRIVNAGVRSAATLVLVSFIFELSLDRIWLILGTMSTVALLAIDREIMRRWFDGRWLYTVRRASRRCHHLGCYERNAPRPNGPDRPRRRS